jgi:hypothetical protein
MSQYQMVPESPNSAARYPLMRTLLAGIIAIVLSTAANLVIRLVGLTLVNVPADLMPLQQLQPVIFFTALFILIATVVWLIITRVSKTPLQTWNKVVPIGFILSILPDLSMPSMDQPVPGMGTFTWPAVLILIAMHLVSGIITWWALPRFSRA